MSDTIRRANLNLLVAVATLTAVSGCGIDFGSCLHRRGPATVRLILVNTSADKFVQPNPGLCPQGLEQTGSHRFLPNPPIIPPGRAVSFTTLQIAGVGGLCANADPNFAVGLCGWKFGPSADNLATQSTKFGGQIGAMFNCGDTVILRWSDTGPECGTWESEILTAPGNDPPSMPFQIIEGGSCAVPA